MVNFGAHIISQYEQFPHTWFIIQIYLVNLSSTQTTLPNHKKAREAKTCFSLLENMHYLKLDTNNEWNLDFTDKGHSLGGQQLFLSSSWFCIACSLIFLGNGKCVLAFGILGCIQTVNYYIISSRIIEEFLSFDLPFVACSRIATDICPCIKIGLTMFSHLS